LPLPRVPFANVGEAVAMMAKTMMMNLFIVREYYGVVVFLGGGVW
jgi:hypothetical protein